jgi:hypothetical protein
MNSQKSENMPINRQPNRRLHRDDLPAIIAVGALLSIIIVIGLSLLIRRENIIEINVGEVVNYRSLLGDFNPRYTYIDFLPRRGIDILFFLLLTSVFVGMLFGSRRSIIIARVIGIFSLIGFGVFSIYSASKYFNELPLPFNEFYQLNHVKFDRHIYNLVEERIEPGYLFYSFDGPYLRYNYWLFECEESEKRCTALFAASENGELAESATDLFIDDSTHALVMTVDNEIVYTIPSEDK